MLRETDGGKKLSCSFCGKPPEAVAKLISSPAQMAPVYICDECVSVCVEILEGDRISSDPAARNRRTVPQWVFDTFFKRPK